MLSEGITQMSAPVDTAPETRDYVLDTYRYLRGGMAVMIVMLGVTVIGERLTATGWQTSISAYHYTTAHSIFIAVLCGLGAQLIVYKGSSDTEDVLLNLAGILAFIVAVVPTTPWPDPMYGDHDLPKYDLHYGITNNVWAVVVALVVAQIVAWLLYWRMGSRRKKSPLGTVSTGILWVVVVLGLVALIFRRQWFDRYAHGVAAVIMFLAIIATVWATTY